ncbi:MAG: hypothetical protein EOO70_09095, partial [Myxococcaceae bacterium]
MNLARPKLGWRDVALAIAGCLGGALVMAWLQPSTVAGVSPSGETRDLSWREAPGYEPTVLGPDEPAVW